MSREPVIPTLEHLLRVHLTLTPPLLVGSGPAGSRRIATINGDEFTGPRLRGNVLAGGGDWTIQRSDHCAQIDARYTLETDDGALVYVQERGLRHGPEHTMARLAKGEPVNPRDYYYRTTAQLETGSPRYAWLNRSVVVGSAMRLGDTVTVDFYTIA